MKYKIFRYGDIYHVKIKQGFFWKWIEVNLFSPEFDDDEELIFSCEELIFSCLDVSLHTVARPFRSENQAVNYMIEQYGLPARRVKRLIEV